MQENRNKVSGAEPRKVSFLTWIRNPQISIKPPPTTPKSYKTHGFSISRLFLSFGISFCIWKIKRGWFPEVMTAQSPHGVNLNPPPNGALWAHPPPLNVIPYRQGGGLFLSYCSSYSSVFPKAGGNPVPAHPCWSSSSRKVVFHLPAHFQPPTLQCFVFSFNLLIFPSYFYFLTCLQNLMFILLLFGSTASLFPVVLSTPSLQSLRFFT